MIKSIITCGLLLCSLVAGAQTFTEWKDPQVNQINRYPMHTNYFAYESFDAVKSGKKSSANYLTLNGQWNFNWVNHHTERPTDFWKVDYNDSDWTTMSVPGMWEISGFGDPIYVNNGYAWGGYVNGMNPPYPAEKNNHVGSYRREIEVPADWKGKQIIAHFGSVTSNIYLWVNGKFVGYSEDSKLAAEFDLTKYLKPGAKNLIAFQVFRWCDGTYLEDQDFFRHSGVGRDCYLYARNKRQIRDIRVTPDLDGQYVNGTLNVDMNVIGGGTVNLKLVDAAGNVVTEKSVAGPGKVTCTLEVENPAKWTAETPNLYTLYATLADGSRVWEVIPVKVGFRKIEIKNAQLLVNGQPVLIKGVNRHEIDPVGGYIFNHDRRMVDVQVLKEFNFNAVRTCHYPADPEWLALCDEYGFYVVCEANIESHGLGYGERTLAKEPTYNLAHLERNQRNVQANWNHPSVIIWSLGNEAGFGQNFIDCYNWIKAEDKSRPVQYEQTHQLAETDIVCPMYAGYEWCERYATNNDPRPLIQCEYAHAMGNSMGGFKEYWDMIRKYPKYQGGFIWDFADQAVLWEKDGVKFYAYGGDFNEFDASDQNFCANGVFNAKREPNPHAYEVKYYYQNIWATPIDLNSGKIEVYNENFFVDLSDYYMEWELAADGKPFQSGRVDELNVAPQQKAQITLNYNLDKVADCVGDLYLNIYFKTKSEIGVLPARFEVAKAQMAIRERPVIEYPVVNCETLIDMTIDNSGNNLVVNGEHFSLSFDKKDGFINNYEVYGKQVIANESKLIPNFWRANTDNDYGANLQRKQMVWENPEFELKAFDSKVLDNGTIGVTVTYNVPRVKGTLTLTYNIANTGTIEVKESFDATEGEEIANMFRFGMRVAIPGSFCNVEYMGRGPIENYSDRNSNTFVGRYSSSVDEQFYGYIRPQEAGNKTDLRWMTLSDAGRVSLTIIAPELFSASALPYPQEAIHDGMRKQQSHPEFLEKDGNTYLCIDKAQQGLACVNSWGAVPLPQYTLPYGDYEFTFVIVPNLDIYR
ncbi:MAG: DUF4981 domain-containing protein [Bacteroidales bacterium]|nr:DUF4981 domain-containing protein [Bacteroidales bacterium]